MTACGSYRRVPHDKIHAVSKRRETYRAQKRAEVNVTARMRTFTKTMDTREQHLFFRRKNG